MHLDDVAVSNYSTGVSDPATERHRWDAFSNQGVLTVTVSNPDGISAGIYTVAGMTVFEGHLGEGSHQFDNIAAGQFVLVSSGDFTRTVLIR